MRGFDSRRKGTCERVRFTRNRDINLAKPAHFCVSKLHLKQTLHKADISHDGHTVMYQYSGIVAYIHKHKKNQNF